MTNYSSLNPNYFNDKFNTSLKNHNRSLGLCGLVNTQTRVLDERSRNIVKVALTIYLYTVAIYFYYNTTLLYQYRVYCYIFPTVDA